MKVKWVYDKKNKYLAMDNQLNSMFSFSIDRSSKKNYFILINIPEKKKFFFFFFFFYLQ